MKTNFTLSKYWIESLLLRYQYSEIENIGGIYFYKKNKLLKCQHFFDFEIKPKVLDLLLKEVLNDNTIRFNYINNSSLLEQLKKWSKDNNLIYKVIDSWEAPRLSIDTSIQNYLKCNDKKQIKRNFRKYMDNKAKYKFIFSNKENVLDLWNDVLLIDYKSWKKSENSDMKSLDREDLQYILFLLKNSNDSSLVVVYENNNPLAYSLMFKNLSDNYWYAVKWGASYDGRKVYAGIYCLFSHLEYIYKIDNKLNIDFWGRRNATYDLLKNDSIVREHLEISKRK